LVDDALPRLEHELLVGVLAERGAAREGPAQVLVRRVALDQEEAQRAVQVGHALSNVLRVDA